MARFTYLFGLTLAACVYHTHAVPLQRRQVQCDAARDAIVVSLNEANIAVTALATAAADDVAASEQVAEAEQGLQLANDGVNDVTQALEQGQAPPQAARDQVFEGLEAALAVFSTLSQVEESAFAPEIIDAQSAVVETIDAGELVLEACGAAANAEVAETAAPAEITAPPAAVADAADAVATVTVTITETVAGAAAATQVAAAGDHEAALQADLDAAAVLELPGSEECNIARTQVVDGLASADSAITALIGEANAEAATLLEDAKAGVDTAQAGVDTIVDTLLAGDAPPVEARDQVSLGLDAAFVAVSESAAADPAIAEQAQSILDGILTTGAAGNDVVALCV